MNHFALAIITLLICSCGTVKNPYYSHQYNSWQETQSPLGKTKIHSLYLLGDAGELDDINKGTNFVLEAVGQAMSQEDIPTSLAYLGDNIYPAGLPKKEDISRLDAEKVLNAQLKLATKHSGTTYFLPGNHDWNEYASGGRSAVLRQEKYIEQYFDKEAHDVKYYPGHACGDPKVEKINKDLAFVFLDTQWWLQDWSKEKKINRGCDIKSRIDYLKRVEEIFLDHKNDEIIVLMHHPIKSDGKHGGNFGLREHLFPLTELNSKLWIPLPLIGSIYPLFRKVSGSIQDIPNDRNTEVMQGIYNVAKKTKVNAVFVSGHEHGLQYFNDGKIKHLISGSSAKHDFIKRGGNADFARDARGFVKISFYENFEAWAEFYTVSNYGTEPILEFKTELRAPRPGTVEEQRSYPDITERTKLIAANEEFAAGNFKKALFGKEYRDMWATPVNAEIINLKTKLGGLVPIKKGGGMASNSLRLEKANGNQYILRSIKKDYTKLIPDALKNLKAVDIVKDQNSASHPYNALIIPKLSKAAGVYFTDPKLVYLQHQEALGNYNELFPEELYLLEERPNGNWSHNANFGNSDEIIGYVDLLEILREKKNHIVDQKWVLKSRIFDLFIHDWDRHDDQWRWAKFKIDGRNIYRPIPRDRDQAFYKFDGIIPWYISTFLAKQLKPMKTNLKDIKHLAFNARHFDRYFLNELDWISWKEVIEELQSNLTNQVIKDAMAGLPDEVESLNFDEELINLLKSRRNQLMEIGRKHYEFINEEIEIHGSDRKDHFELKYLSNGEVELNVHVHYDDGELSKYHRVFDPSVTNEIRLYGLRGKDEFHIDGSHQSKIKIRIIGGEDEDIVFNNTYSNNVIAYDDLKGIVLHGLIKDKRSDDLHTNEYDRESFKYNTSFPTLTFGSTLDDGFWLGGSISWLKHGWRNHPYKSKQRIKFRGAITTGTGFEFNYSGHFPKILGALDFYPNIDFKVPHYVNYFGLGNDTSNPLTNTEYHWVRHRDLDIYPQLALNIGNSGALKFGPLYQYRSLENTEDRVSNDEILGFDEDAFNSRNYTGANVEFDFGIVNNSNSPSNGLTFNFSLTHLIESEKEEKVTTIDVNSRFYLKLLSSPSLVLANQFGYQKSIGDLQFYQYADLGNNKGLRGYRNERFRGHSAFYHNIDLRANLFYWKNKVLPMQVGLLLGYDYGKVNINNELSDKTHRSQTVGLWFNILDSFILQPYYSFNNEQNTFSLQSGFNF